MINSHSLLVGYEEEIAGVSDGAEKLSDDEHGIGSNDAIGENER